VQERKEDVIKRRLRRGRTGGLECSRKGTKHKLFRPQKDGGARAKKRGKRKGKRGRAGKVGGCVGIVSRVKEKEAGGGAGGGGAGVGGKREGRKGWGGVGTWGRAEECRGEVGGKRVWWKKGWDPGCVGACRRRGLRENEGKELSSKNGGPKGGSCEVNEAEKRGT